MRPETHVQTARRRGAGFSLRITGKPCVLLKRVYKIVPEDRVKEPRRQTENARLPRAPTHAQNIHSPEQISSVSAGLNHAATVAMKYSGKPT